MPRILLGLLLLLPTLATVAAPPALPRIEWAGVSDAIVLLGTAAPDEVKAAAAKLAGDGATTYTLGQKDAAIPGVTLGAHKDQATLLAALAKTPDRFGITLTDDAALVVKGRELKAVGPGTVSLLLPAANGRPARTETLKAGATADLTAWRRAARERGLAFPPKEVPACVVPNGSLVIVGGGGMPADVTKKFIELAGGPDALIVIIPLASGDGPPKGNEGAFFERAGAKNVKQLAARSQAEVDDPKTLALLKEAKGVWFGGGRHWRFVDSYEGTQGYELFHDVLKRGGVIGGSSAGASIQGDYLCRADPLGNLNITAEGYERGFAFLPGSAIDQHFAQRKRFADMSGLMKTFPQYLGIGLDENTAIVVRGSVAEVMGKNEVHFYDARRKPAEGAKDHQSLKAGGKYDVQARKVLAPE